MGLKSWLIKTAISYAKPYIKEAVTVDTLAGYATDAVDWVASKGLANVKAERLVQVHRGCVIGADVFGEVAKSLAPESNGGREITADEKEPIKMKLRDAVNSIVTQEQLDAIVDATCDKIINKMEG